MRGYAYDILIYETQKLRNLTLKT